MAGKSILDVVIKVSKQGGADKETIKGLVNLKSGIMEAAAVAGTLVAAGYTIKAAFDATVGTFVSYADEVRNVAQMTGLTAEESSKLVQVTDDYKVSAEDLQKVIAKNGDIYDYSIEGLAGMSAEYNSLATAEEKAAFMQEHFGKNWGQFVELMEQGGEKIQAAGDGISEALILDQAALDSAREYQMQLDQLSDSWDAVKISAGNAATPIVVTFLQEVNRELEMSQQNLSFVSGLWSQFNVSVMSAGSALGVVSLALPEIAGGNEAAAKSFETLADASTETADTMIDDYGRILNDAQKLFEAQKDYAQEYQSISQDMSLSDDERAAKLQALGAKYDAVSLKIVSDNMLQKLSVDGLEQAEYERFLAFQVATGQMTSAAAEQAAALNEIAAAGAEGTLTIQQMQQAIDALNDKTITLTINTVWNGGGGASDIIWDEFGFNEIVEAKAPGETLAGVSGGVAVGGGAAPIVVNLTMNNVMSLGDRAQAEREILPFVIAGIREAQARGVI